MEYAWEKSTEKLVYLIFWNFNFDVVLFQSLVPYRLVFRAEKQLKNSFLVTFRSEMNANRSRCQARGVLVFIRDAFLRAVVLGRVVFESDVVRLLGSPQSCFPAVTGPDVMVDNEMDDMPTKLSSYIVWNSPSTVNQLDLEWFHNLIRWNKKK